jgi:SAM-dependent methyltransferase
MHADIVDLREFYLSSLGRTARRLLRAHLNRLWPNARGERVLALGYVTPIIRPLFIEAGTVIAAMPAAQGVAYWPREGPNISCLADTDNLPLPDEEFDRVILMHALEGVAEPHSFLREVRRVLKAQGRLLMIVPNRRGLWAHSDRTPFGSGQPYSASQIRSALKDHGLLIDRVSSALYVPPTSSRLWLSMANTFEKWGEKLFPGFGGVWMIEAGKQLYTPAPLKTKAARRLVLPLPMPASSPSNPIPAGRISVSQNSA